MGLGDGSTNRLLFGPFGLFQRRGLLQFCGGLEYDFAHSSNGFGVDTLSEKRFH